MGGEYQDHSVETVDAGGLAKKAINPNNIIGCVVYPATFTQAPGVIRYDLQSNQLSDSRYSGGYKGLARNMMAEAQTIAEKLGVTFRVDIERRIAGAEKVGKHKTSMLRDLEAGRSLEIDALLGSVIELGKITQIPTPCLNTVFALTKYLDENVQASKGSLALPSVSGY